MNALAPPHVHRWVLSGEGSTVSGRCRRCGARRQFRNSGPEQSVWETQGRGLRAVIQRDVEARYAGRRDGCE